MSRRPVRRQPGQLVALVGPTLHGVRWDIPATAAGLAIAALSWNHAQLTSPESALWFVRGSALLLTLGALPLLDDPAAPQVAAVPVPLVRRAAIRLVGFVALVFFPVGGLAAWTHLPVGSILLEASAIVVLAGAASMLMTRLTDHTEPSTAVSLGLLPLPGLLVLLPQSAALIVPEGPQWAAAHQRWAVLSAVGVVALWLSLRDPAARVVVRRRRAGS